MATGGLALGYALKEKDSSTRDAILLAYGAGATLGAQLPFSRLHENESDEIGLMYMARAGYDPRAAVRFWQRMKETQGAGVAEFLSTHPSHDSRIDRLNSLMPEALEAYEQTRQRG